MFTFKSKETELLSDIEESLARLGYRLSPKAVEVFLNTLLFSKKRDYDIYTENYLYGLLRSNSIAVAVFENLGVNPIGLKRDAIKSLRNGTAESWSYYVEKGTPPNMYWMNSWLIDHFVRSAKYNRRKTIQSSDILCGLVTISKEDYSQEEDEPQSFFHELMLNRGLSLQQIRNELSRLRRFEPFAERIQYWLTSHRNRLLIQPFSFFNSYNVYPTCDRPDEKLVIAKLDLVHDLPFISFEEINELNWLINQPNVTEDQLQKFFEHHPKFLLGVEYKNHHSQLVLTKDTGERLVPDFFLEKIGSDFCDIVDLKKPNVRLISGRRNRRGFSRHLTEALSQLREYRNFFYDAKNRKAFHRKYGLEAFRPTVSVIIGRSRDYFSEIERKEIEEEYSNLKVLTYDDVLERAKQQAVSLTKR